MAKPLRRVQFLRNFFTIAVPNPCEPNPCENNGNCSVINAEDGIFACACLELFEGNRCEIGKYHRFCANNRETTLSRWIITKNNGLSMF